MNLSDAQYAGEKLSLLKSEFLVEIHKDWGDETGSWQSGYWVKEELDKLHNTLDCFAECIGGPGKVRECTGGVTVHVKVSVASGVAPWRTVIDVLYGLCADAPSVMVPVIAPVVELIDRPVGRPVAS